MREKLLIGLSLLVLLGGCSSAQHAPQYGPIQATPGMTGNPPPVGPPHPMAGSPNMNLPGFTPGMPQSQLPGNPSRFNGNPMPGSPPTAGRMPNPALTGQAFGRSPGMLDSNLISATYVETGSRSGKPPIMPMVATAQKQAERSDLLYATTSSLVPQPPTPREPVVPESQNTTATTSATSTPSAPGAPSAGGDSAPGLTPVMRSVGTKNFTLAFEMKDAAPGSTVEAWATQDQKNWIRVRSTLQPPSALSVEVPAEGTYGLLLLVKNGTAPARTPRSGEAPHIWLTVDSTKPAVDLLGVDLSLTSRAPSLIVRWKASDRNFGPRPMTLSYAESTEGPWIPLASAVPNNGRHEAPLPHGLPRKMLVRVEGTDAAGNQGTSQPVRVELPSMPTEGAQRPASQPTLPRQDMPARISVVDLTPSDGN